MVCALSVLELGLSVVRYVKDKTQVIFAERKQAISTNPDKTDPARQISKVYGDLGLLMSWFYQPHDQTKTHSLCLIPHYVDMRSPFVRLIRQQWKGSHVIDIAGPLFAIAYGGQSRTWRY
jgi:hypothetical protein